MATYTPNLNLGKPEATDPFGNFRQLFNDNMDILDNGGGGGSGGHTIVNPSGTDMPAEGKLQFTGGVTVTDDSVNGKTVVDISGGGGNVYGAFIDTSRVIASGTYSSSNPLVYTATEDCFADIAFLSADGDTNVYAYIDGVRIDRLFNNSGIVVSNEIYPLRKGQTLRVETSRIDPDSAYTIYGLTQGTSGIFTPIIYSDTERVVGVWRDNKPLYQKSVYVGSLSAGSGVSLAHNIANIDTIANYEGIGFNTVESRWNTLPRVDDDVTYQRGLAVGTTNIVIWGASNVQAMTGVTVTIWYTKTTDVAGSGNWNTDGVPTVHYSTSEQVIGTWTNNKPLYQRTYSLTGGIVIGSYGHISLPANSIVRGLDGYAYRNSHASVDRFNGFINSGDLYASIRSGDIEYWISNIFNPVEEIEFTVQYTKVTD